MKQKGVSDAILSCARINEEQGDGTCVLDIFGPIAEDYREEFSELCEKYKGTVTYKGVIHPSESVATLKDYYMLLFPTLFYTEGIPGTIIDAFSAGVPVLASEWESYRDVLSERDSVTFKFADSEAFYDKLRFCIQNPSIINGFRKDCLGSAKKFSSSEAVRLLLNILENDKEI